MKRILALSLLLLLLLVQAWRARPRELTWAPDFPRALALAREERAWVVVHLRQASRPLGARMDEETLTARAVELAARAGFVHVKLDADAEPTLAARLAGPGAALSTLVVAPIAPIAPVLPSSMDGMIDHIGETGEVIARRDGFVEAGDFVRFLEEVRARRPTLERQQQRLTEAPDDIAVRVGHAELLMELGASSHAEAELRLALDCGEQGERDGRSSASATPTAAQGLLLAHAHERLARLLAERGQAALAREELARFDRHFDGIASAGTDGAAPPPEWADAAVITEALLQWLERREEDALVMLEALVARYPPSPCAAEAQALRATWQRK